MTSHLKDEIAPAALCYYRVSREISLIAPSLGNKDPMQCTLETWILEPIQYLNSFLHRRQKCEHCSPNSLRPISYFGSIWELYVLDLKTKVFCKKKNQIRALKECEHHRYKSFERKQTKNLAADLGKAETRKLQGKSNHI